MELLIIKGKAFPGGWLAVSLSTPLSNLSKLFVAICFPFLLRLRMYDVWICIKTETELMCAKGGIELLVVQRASQLSGYVCFPRVSLVVGRLSKLSF